MYNLYTFVYNWWQYIIYNYYTYTNQKYPFWFIQTFNNKTVPYSFKRNYNTQLAYNNRSNDARNLFIYNIFTPNDIKYSFIPNTYPYNIADDVIHYVLWINPDINTYDILLKMIISDHVKLLNHSINFCFFKNSLSNKSIPEIEHYHVFIKR